MKMKIKLRVPSVYPMYFYHTDHLGTSTALTDFNGNAYQFFLNLPFGETMAEQHSQTEEYENPYKFNGKELDQETGLYYYGARYYDPRVSIWMSTDPMMEKYPNANPYNYTLQNPINAIDPDGREIIFIIGGDKGKSLMNFRYSKGNFYNVETGKRYNPAKEGISKTMYRVLAAYRKIEASDDEVLKNQLHTLEKSKNKHLIKEHEGINNVTGNGLGDSDYRINFSEDERKRVENSTGVPVTDLTTIVHEMRHQYDQEIGNMGDSGYNLPDNKRTTAEDPAEIRGVYNENRARKIENLPKRIKYFGKEIDHVKLNNPPNNINKPLKK